MDMNERKIPCNSNLEEDKKAFFERESKSLMKEVEELSKEYGVEACAIIYNPFDGNERMVWPSTEGVLDVMSKCGNLQIPESEPVLEPEALPEERDEDEIENEKEIRDTMFHHLSGERDLKEMSDKELKDLAVLVERYLNEINNKLSSVGLTASTSAASATDEGNGDQQAQGGDEAKGNAPATENNGD